MSTTSELETKILEDFLHYFLPEGLLDYFEPVKAEDKEHQIKKVEVYKRILHLYFDERDNRPAELQHLRPNGFTEEKVISDFPARNRKLVLHIRQRRWLDEDGKSVILNVYELATNGTKFSDEFAEFLKKNLDQPPVTAKSLGRSYMIDADTLDHACKYTWSGFLGWEHRSHADNWVLLPDNLGPHLSIDESCLHDDLFTIVTNKEGHGRSGTIVAMVRGTKAEDVIKVLMQIPEEERKKVKEVTMDLSESMRSIIEAAFPDATITLDCFHIMKRCLEAVEELRLRYKREAQAEINREMRATRNARNGMPTIGDGTQGPIQGNTRARSADARPDARTNRSDLRS